MKRFKQATLVLSVTTLTSLLSLPLAHAKKPGGGGPGGGHGGGETPSATVITLAYADGFIHDLTETVDGVAEVVGAVYLGDGGPPIPMHWYVDAGGTVLASSLLPVATGAHTSARAVNNNGMIVGGELDPATGVLRALFWPTATSSPLELPVPEGTYAFATGINDAGQIVGQLRTAPLESDYGELIVWQIGEADAEPVVLDWQVFDVGTLASAVLSPSAGFVAYTIHPSDGESRACRLQIDWDGTQLVEVAGSRMQLFDANSYTSAVNNLGTVVGRSDTATDPNDPAGGRGAYAMTLSGSLLNLPTLPSGRIKGIRYEWINTNADAINDSDLIIVNSHRTGSFQSYTDVLTIPGGSATDLKDYAADWAKYSASDVNNEGWIAGAVLDPSGDEFPVVLILP